MKKILLICFYLPFASTIQSQSTVHVSSGTFIRLSNSIQLTLENADLINNGTINLAAGDGSFKFSGNSSTNISGGNKPIFDVLVLAKTGTAQLILQRDIDVVGNVNFSSGIFHLNTHVVDLNTTGSVLNEDESKHFIGPTGGYIQFTGNLNAPSFVNPGNLGAIITTTQNLGTTIIRRGHQSQMNGYGNGSSILRYFDILPSNNTSLNASLQINYLDAETNGLTENFFALWRSSNLPNWSLVGFDARNAISNSVYKTGIPSFSRWTISTVNNPLPVKFSLFNTACGSDGVVIKWITETEVNSSHFEVQKSVDGRTWIAVANLPATGNSSNSLKYSFTDNASAQNSFYRIAEYDIDGKISYTPVSRVSCGNRSEFKLWPNPSIGIAYLSINTTTGGKADLKVIDGKGTMVYSKQTELFAGNNLISIDIHSLASGNYIVQLIINGETRSIKLIKQ